MNCILLALHDGEAVMQRLMSVLAELFGGDYPADPLKLHQIVARATVVYLVGLAIVRVGKSRMIARVTALDVLLGFILGSLLSRGITGHASISGTATASATIALVHWILTFITCRSHTIGTMLKGDTRLLVKDGRLDERAMLYSHVSPHDLAAEIRLKGLETIEDVHLAYRERNGEVSVIPRKKLPRMFEVSVQDGVQKIRIEID